MDIAVYESKRSTALLLAGLSLLLGVWVVWSGAGNRAGDALSVLLVGGALTVYGVIYFLIEANNPRRLRVTHEALLIERRGKPALIIAWNDIERFVVVRRRALTLLGYRLRRGAQRPAFSSITRLFEGADAVLYGFWPNPPKVMAEILNHYAETLKTDQPTPHPVEPTVTRASVLPATASANIRPAAASVQPPSISEPFRLFRRKSRDGGPGNSPIVR